MRRRDHIVEATPPWDSRIPALRLLRALYPPNLLHILRSVNTDQLSAERGFLGRHPLGAREWGIVFPHGMGDLYLACAFAEAVLQQRGGDGFAVFVRPHHAYIPTLFRGVSRVVVVSDFNLKRIQQNFHFEKGRLFSVFPLHNFLNVVGYKGVDFLDYYCLFLNLALGTRPSVPRPQTPVELDAGRRLLAERGLRPGRTVVLAPEASSINPVPDEFWGDLAAELRGRGFDVVLNDPAGTSRIPGASGLNIPIAQFIAVAESAGWVISMRSGLCELVSQAKCRLTVVYPEENDEVRRRLARGFGLVASGLRPDAVEVWYRAGHSSEAVDRIVALGGQRGAELRSTGV